MIEIMREDLVNEGCLTKSNDYLSGRENDGETLPGRKQGRIKVEGTFTRIFRFGLEDGKISPIRGKLMA